MLRDAKKRARKKNIPFTIDVSHVVIPEFCPVFGMKLVKGAGAASPSLDRIRPELGYVPGNVWVISYRANTIKSDATLQELRTLTERLERVLS